MPVANWLIELKGLIPDFRLAIPDNIEPYAK